MKMVEYVNPYPEAVLAHLGKLQWIRAGVEGEVDDWPLMSEWIECKTDFFTIKTNCTEVFELIEEFSWKGIYL